MARKLPAMQFYTGDWKKDPALSLCGPATRGIWVDLLCAMHDDDRCGTVSGTVVQLARIGRCNEAEMAAAIDELAHTKTAHVTFRHDNISICNRRMNAEYRERKGNSHRQKRRRAKTCRGDVAQKSRSHSSSSSSSSDLTTLNLPLTPTPKNELVEAWNSTPGVVQIRKLSSSRSTKLGTRLADPDWDWRAALAKFPLACFDDGGWAPTFEWFLRPDTVLGILEGKYDWRKDAGQATPSRRAEAMNFTLGESAQ